MALFNYQSGLCIKNIQLYLLIWVDKTCIDPLITRFKGGLGYFQFIGGAEGFGSHVVSLERGSYHVRTITTHRSEHAGKNAPTLW